VDEAKKNFISRRLRHHAYHLDRATYVPDSRFSLSRFVARIAPLLLLLRRRAAGVEHCRLGGTRSSQALGTIKPGVTRSGLLDQSRADLRLGAGGVEYGRPLPAHKARVEVMLPHQPVVEVAQGARCASAARATPGEECTAVDGSRIAAQMAPVATDERMVALSAVPVAKTSCARARM
jgi:hypothetical protein